MLDWLNKWNEKLSINRLNDYYLLQWFNVNI